MGGRRPCVGEASGERIIAITVGGELDELSRFRGCLLGLAVGDAVGATVEFKERGSFSPMSDMVGGGPHGL